MSTEEQPPEATPATEPSSLSLAEAREQRMAGMRVSAPLAPAPEPRPAITPTERPTSRAPKPQLAVGENPVLDAYEAIRNRYGFSNTQLAHALSQSLGERRTRNTCIGAHHRLRQGTVAGELFTALRNDPAFFSRIGITLDPELQTQLYTALDQHETTAIRRILPMDFAGNADAETLYTTWTSVCDRLQIDARMTNDIYGAVRYLHTNNCNTEQHVHTLQTKGRAEGFFRLFGTMPDQLFAEIERRTQQSLTEEEKTTLRDTGENLLRMQKGERSSAKAER